MGSQPRPALLHADERTGASGHAISVVLAEDHRTLRRSLRGILDAADGIDVVAEAMDVATVARSIQRYEPHVLILDLHLPDGQGLTTIRQLAGAAATGMAIVVLTMEDSPEFAREVLHAGARGYVLKDHADDDLVDSVRHTSQGLRYVSPAVDERRVPR